MTIETYKLNQNHDAQAPEDLTRIGFGHGAAVKLAQEINCLAESELPAPLGNLKKFA
ncbi:hypothetical protein JHN63_24110 [Streptomyces sp. MBT65]|uniref:hypothetical protein n=1 Tax=Streptomyces sp. MBT65 TaxID=1488395 RepID=UPI00190E190D|nr:hypothetical protein [Streptomyces sp. MBT65]MBK3576835.1 hypothetical protein [Streptomyces sp. MBT65]